MAELRIGASGWAYKHWTGEFYTKGLKPQDALCAYAEHFDTVEVNSSFYQLPGEETLARWLEETPQGFVFAWKASRFITHVKRLKDVGESLELAFRRMHGLGERLGPLLFQLPPNMKPDSVRLDAFLTLLPKDHRGAIEFRDPAWYESSTFDLLRAHGVALCISDHHSAPAPKVTTTSFVYVRAHGPSGRYVGDYRDEALKALADPIKGWLRKGFDVYAYFDNDIGAAAPRNAERLRALIKGRSCAPPRSARPSRRSG